MIPSFSLLEQWPRDNPLPQISSVESIFRIWDYSYYYFYYYCTLNSLCEFKFQFSEQKPHAHKNINFCPTSKGGKIQRPNRSVPKRAQLRISGAIRVWECVCVWTQSRQRRKDKEGRGNPVRAYFNVTLLCFSNFSRVLRCAFPYHRAPLFPLLFSFSSNSFQ